jgi:hypothetical protein
VHCDIRLYDYILRPPLLEGLNERGLEVNRHTRRTSVCKNARNSCRASIGVPILYDPDCSFVIDAIETNYFVI